MNLKKRKIEKLIPIIKEKIKEISFFEEYQNDEAILKQIIDLCELKTFKKGQTLIKEGDTGDELFIIINGTIDILKNTLQNQTYLVTTLSAESGGVYVGELALIDEDRRSATVVAKSQCHCLVLKRDDFVKFGDQHPSIGLHITRSIARQLSQKLRKTNTDVITLFSALVEEISSES